MEMSEMIATANAKSIEEIKSFLSKQKETYKIPYETHPADRLRQCVFAGTTNRQDFLPRDRTRNRRFIPIPVDAAQAEVHILDNEAETRAICEIMTAGIANGEIKGWTVHKAAKRYPKYGVQKGWERVTAAKVDADGFVELTDEEAQQMGFPF